MRKLTLITVLSLSLGTHCMAQHYWERLIPFPSPLDSRCDTVSVYIIGDVMMHSAQLNCDFNTFFRDIAPEMRESDICVANMEFTLAGEPYSGYPAFSAPDSYAWYMAGECGTDIFLTANNHITDKGRTGLARTLEIYDTIRDSLGTRHIGTSRNRDEEEDLSPVIMHCKGLSLAFINFTYGTNSGVSFGQVSLMDKESVGAAISRAKENNADFIIALPHWGDEYMLRHNGSQEEWAEWLADSGVDIIVGSHPHVVQDTAHVKGVPVIYSVGNAVSNMSARNTRLELAVTLRFIHDERKGIKKMLEPELDFLWCTLPGMLVPDSFATVSIKKWASRKNDWLNESDFENMISTLERVRSENGTGN